jgi:predicted porin
MRKMHWFALSALSLAVTASMAQSSVSIYGVMDAGVMRTTGMKGGTQNRVVSGIMEGSRLGFRGTEDIGGGWRATFLLENRLEADTGSNSSAPPSGSQLPDRWNDAALLVPALTALPAQLRAPLQGALDQRVFGPLRTSLGNSLGVNVGNARFWDRQAFLGLITPFGAVLAGRQYTPSFEVNGVFDIMGTQSSLAAGQVAAVPAVIDIRQSNAVQLRIVKGGLTASLMAAPSEGSTSQGKFYGGLVIYRGEGFAVGAAINKRENELGQKSLSTTTFGASMDIGPGKLSVLGNIVKDDNPAGLNAAIGGVQAVAAGVRAQVGAAGALIDPALMAAQFKSAFVQDASTVHVGYKLTSGAHTFYTAFNRLNDKGRQNADTDSYGVAYSYAFSKRTDLNAVFTHFNNKGLGQAAPGQNGFLGGFASTAGADPNSLAVGIRHRF